MSTTTIDQKVVEMCFDNKHFEKNTRESMSTLDKLKEKLNFKGASKGLEELNKSSNKVDMRGMSNALDNVNNKFSALEIMGVTALANITNSAVNAGKRIVSALTIDPVMAGMREYETKMGSIQTILANTEHQGTTLDDVTAALEELNLYADKTIYNFQEMTRNIGTFTAAGVDLDTSVSAIKGIANLAAVSGSTSQQASTAMYQLSQALSTGTVRLQDWNSVVNAGMGGKVFQTALIRTAAMMDGAAQDVEAWQAANIDSYGSFRDSLTQGAWLTTDVLTETLRQFTMAAKEGSEEWEAFKAELMQQGYSEAQANEILRMANTASDAATKVKTFTQLFDTLKESAQSGWAQTWELIFGDFEEAKEFFTGLSEMIGGIIESMSEFRNTMLGGALDSNWDKFVNKLTKAGIKSTEYEESLREVIKAYGVSEEELDDLIEEYGSLEKVIKEGLIPTEWLTEALEKLGISADGTTTKVAGFVEGLKSISRNLRRGNTGKDVKKLQKALHELGYDLGKPGIDGIIGPITERAIKEFQKEAGLVVDGIAGPKTLAALKEAGKSVEKITGNVDEMGESYEDLLGNITQKGGRELFLEAFSNIINGITGALKAMGEAWAYVFPAEDTQRGILSFLEKFNAFTQRLKLTKEVTDEFGNKTRVLNENGEKLAETFGGIFAVLKMVTTILSFPLKIAFKVLTGVLGHFHLNILDVTSAIGRVLMGIEEFLFENNIIIDALVAISLYLIDVVKSIGRFIKQLWLLPEVQKFFEPIVNFFKSLKDLDIKDIGSAFKKLGSGIVSALSGLNELFHGVPGDIIAGLVNGLKGGIKNVVKAIVELAGKLVTKFEEILGIESPSKVFFAIGGFIIAGLIGGLLNGIPGVNTTLEEITGNITGFFESIDWGKIFAAFMSGGLVMVVKNLTATVSNITAPLKGVGELLSGTGEFMGKIGSGVNKILKKTAKGVGQILKSTAQVVKAFTKIEKAFANVLNGIAFKKKMEGVKELGITLLLLVGALYIVTKIDPDRLWESVGVIMALAVILGILAVTISELTQSTTIINKEGFKSSGVQSMLLSIAGIIIILASVVKMLGKMKPEQVIQGFLALEGIMITLVIIVSLLAIVNDKSKAMNESAESISKISKAILLLAIACTLIGLLSLTAMGKGALFLVGFLVFVGLLRVILTVGKKNEITDMSDMIWKISKAILLLVITCKLIGLLSPTDMGKGALFLVGFLAFVGLLRLILTVGNKKKMADIGKTLLSVSGAMLILALVVKIIGGMDFVKLAKGIFGIGLLAAIVSGLILVVKLVGNKAPKIAGTILAIGVAIGLLAAAAMILSLVNFGGLLQGVAAISALMYMLSVVVKSTKGATDVKGTLIGMAITIGVLAASVAVLSFIDPARLAIATVAIGALLGMLALVLSQSKNVAGSLGVLITLTAAIVIIGLVIWGLTKLPLENVLGVTLSLSTFLLSMAGVLAILKLIGPTATAALPAMGVLALFVAGLIAFIGLVGYLVNKITGAEGYIQKGLEILVMIAEGLGVMVGAFIKAALEETSKALPVIGENLSLFMEKASDFFTAVQDIDGKSLLAGVGSITAAIMLLTAASFLQALTTFMSGGLSSLPLLGQNLSDFIVAALPFLATVMLIDPAIFHGVKALAEAILLITAADLLDGIKLLGQSSLEKFGSELKHLGTGLKDFITALGPVTDTEVDTAVNAATIIEKIANATSKIPNSGGLLAALVGDNKMEDWAAQLLCLARGIAAFAITMRNSGITDEDVTTAGHASDIITKLAEASKKLPNTGGLLQQLIGTNDLTSFASGLPEVGKGIAGFVKAMQNNKIGEDDTKTANAAAKMIYTLADAADKVPEVGGKFQEWFGTADLTTFASQMPNLGKGIADFIKALIDGGFDASKISVAEAATQALNAIAKIGELAQFKSFTKGLGKFGSELEDLGEDIADFIDELKDISNLDVVTNINKVYKIIALANKAAGVNHASLGTFSESLVTFAEEGVEGFIDAFNDKTSADDVTKGATALKDAAIKVITAADLYNKSYGAGENFAKGFANGIRDNAYKAKLEAGKMGSNAKIKLDASVGNASPSKETFKSGNFFGLGFVNGIKNTMSKVYETSQSIGDKAKTGLSKAISKVSDLINSDIDTQPTIRPVLDLSDVESGATHLNGMFSNVGIGANLNAISSSMRLKAQNGVNSEVVSAIDNLRKDLGNISGTTNNYNVNGVTYDDGSNIRDAVETIIRAAIVERRM